MYKKEAKGTKKFTKVQNEMRDLYNMYNHWDKLLNYMTKYFSEESPEFKTVLGIMDKVEKILDKRTIN